MFHYFAVSAEKFESIVYTLLLCFGALSILRAMNYSKWFDAKAIITTIITAILIGLWSRFAKRPRLSVEIKRMRPAVAPESSKDFRCDVAVKNVGGKAAIVEKIIGFGVTYDGERKKLSHKIESPALSLLPKGIEAGSGVVTVEAVFHPPHESIALLEVQAICRYGWKSEQRVRARRNFPLGFLLDQEPWLRRVIRQWVSRMRKRLSSS
jgi:hypothetical protein